MESIFLWRTHSLSAKLAKFQNGHAMQHGNNTHYLNGSHKNGKQSTDIVPGNPEAAYAHGKVRDVQSKYADYSADLRHDLLNRGHGVGMCRGRNAATLIQVLGHVGGGEFSGRAGLVKDLI